MTYDTSLALGADASVTPTFVVKIFTGTTYVTDTTATIGPVVRTAPGTYRARFTVIPTPETLPSVLWTADGVDYEDASPMTVGVTSSGATVDDFLDEPLSRHRISGTVGAALNSVLPVGATAIVAASPAPTVTTFKVSSLVGTITNRAYAVFTSGSRQGESSRVLSYNRSSGIVTVADTLSAAPSAGDTVMFLGFH